MLLNKDRHLLIVESASVTRPLHAKCLELTSGDSTIHPRLIDHLLLMTTRGTESPEIAELVKPTTINLITHLSDLWTLCFYWQANLSKESQEGMHNSLDVVKVIDFSRNTYHTILNTLPKSKTESTFTSLAAISFARYTHILSIIGVDHDFDTSLQAIINGQSASLNLLYNYL